MRRPNGLTIIELCIIITVFTIICVVVTRKAEGNRDKPVPPTKEMQIIKAGYAVYKGEPYPVESIDATEGIVHLQANGHDLMVPLRSVGVQ